MKVKELIEILSELDQDKDIYLEDQEMGGGGVEIEGETPYDDYWNGYTLR